MNSHFSYRLDFRNPVNRFLLIVFILLLSTGKLFAGNLTLAWNASTSGNVGGYKIFYGLSSGNYTGNVDAGKSTSFQVTGLTNGAKYFFAVKAYNSTKTIQSAFSNEISATVPSTATLTSNFSTNKTSGGAPLVVSFTPVTTGTVTGWSWNFGDTAIPVSTSQNPTVTYSKPGTYSVRLTITGTGGSATLTKAGLITVTSTPVANFSATPKTGNAPLTVGFSDSSSGNISTRLWNFGDGTTSAALNPNHIYTAAGIYNVSLKVTGPNGSNTKTSSGFINVTTSTTTVPPTQGLVAAYSFEENGGNIIADASGKGNHGILKEATHVLSGRHHGKMLKFDGVNDWISVKDSPSLDLSSGYTLEAWVRPLSAGPGNIITKEQVGGSVYSLYSSQNANVPIAALNDGTAYRVVSGPAVVPINKWTHLVSTYNGAYQRLYVNGVQVAIRAQTGSIKKSNGVLRIGGNSIWGQYFHGYIDDIRIYNRALNNTEIAKDFTTATNYTSPARVVAGNKNLEIAIDYNPQGIAEAFKTVLLKNAMMTDIRIYLDASSSGTELILGIYNDNLGHPGKLLAQGKSTKLSSGHWNRVPIPTVNLVAAKPYWIAILGSKGQIKFRDRLGAGSSPLESSASTTLTTLPTIWVTGKVFPKDGPISSFGVGYTGP